MKLRRARIVEVPTYSTPRGADDPGDLVCVARDGDALLAWSATWVEQELGHNGNASHACVGAPVDTTHGHWWFVPEDIVLGEELSPEEALVLWL